MNIYEPSDPQFREGGDRSFRARHADMAHAGARFGHQTLLKHLIIGEEGAIEEDDGRPLEAGCQRLIDGGATWDIE